MRDYGRVHSAFWSSGTTRGMSEDARHLALYLLTCPHGTIAGVFRLPDGYACEDLQWSSERVREGFVELFRNGFANRCETTKWVWIAKHFEWNPLENPNQRKSAARIFAQVPDNCVWKADYTRDCGVFLGMQDESPGNRSETLSKPFPNQEQYQYQKQEKKNKTPPARDERARGALTSTDGFDRFWDRWPRKIGKAQAEKAWAKLRPEAPLQAQILVAVGRQCESDAWRKDGGAFIPHAATWLNGRRWEDELGPVSASYSTAELEVMAAYNVALAERRGWPAAVADPFSADRAAALRAFLGFGSKAGWVESYFGWLGEHLPAKEGFGLDWAIQRATYLRAKEGNFAVLREGA